MGGFIQHRGSLRTLIFNRIEQSDQANKP